MSDGTVVDIGEHVWPWFAISTSAGREKSASSILEHSGYECYLPVSRLTRKWSDRTKRIDVPLFPGYFFCRLNQHNRLPVLMVPGVIQIVGVGKSLTPIDDAEIAAIQRLGASSMSATPWPYLGVGQVARIDAGPLRGLSGIVIKVKSGMKLVLSVSLLQRSVAVEIDCAWISEATTT